MEEIHGFYEVKLETLKREMVDSFMQEMQNEKQKTFEELAKIRENYQTKIAMIS